MKEILFSPFELIKKPLGRILAPTNFGEDLLKPFSRIFEQEDCDEKEKGGDCDDGTR